MNYVAHVLTLILLYYLLALSVNLLLGHGGLLPLCQAALQAVGAYGATLLVMKAGWGFVPAAAAAVGAAGVLAYLVAVPFQKFRGDYFVLATMGFQVILVTAANNLVSVTNGPYGISGIPRPGVLGWTPRSVPAFLGFTAVAAALVTVVFRQLTASPFGRNLRAVRDDPVAAASVGLDVSRYRRAAFAAAGGIAAFAGALQAAYVSYIDPTYYGLEESILVVMVVVVGGAGGVLGPLLGAAFLILLPEVLRFVELPQAAAASVRQIVFGALLVVLLRVRRQGIIGSYALD